MGEIAGRMGCEDVPRTYRETVAFMQDRRGELTVGPRTREIVALLLDPEITNIAFLPLQRLSAQAAVDRSAFARFAHPVVVELSDHVSDAAAIGGAVTLRLGGLRRTSQTRGWWPYGSGPAQDLPATEPVALVAVPYFTWGNREPGAMRVWVPTS
jgi:hypothetical protein